MKIRFRTPDMSGDREEMFTSLAAAEKHFNHMVANGFLAFDLTRSKQAYDVVENSDIIFTPQAMVG